MNIQHKIIGIKKIEYYLPKKELTNKDLEFENPDWDMEKVEIKSGVKKRYISAVNETALDLSINACKILFKNNEDILNRIDGIIYCTQSPDYIMPSNAFLVQRHFGIKNNLFAFDYNLACSGYIYGLAMCQSFIKSGLLKNVILINADTYTKYINKKDRSARVLFGDGAAVSNITTDSNDFEIIDFAFSSSGKDYNKFIIPAGGCRIPKSEKTATEIKDTNGNIRSDNDIYMDGMAVWVFINTEVPRVIKEILLKNNLEFKSIDKFIFHQASKMTLDSLIKVLKLNPDICYFNIENIGNTVSASIPIALKNAIDSRFIKKGDLCLLAGFGVGLSVAACLVRF